ncbi:fumarylacetoacetate hydrolase family protein [Peribacillus huizhouensis]|uniref:2-keto-4-pentenoate hydratase/2-oxohepta-3-ene-1,7-dioic acid hydratase in catechol pathway n=1 Tax=Peribacillus huizhouensis TaxID=1501239 RepID=A0ABR6CKT3_9BACI|nr:fumarylacetoacetate hydrolase family protein [Peribacillus huizhouensis]MBA9025228.1 2-keto-4-pentenoate hydratase/2-oxohepta-3-ene-1,7-dioic acid hydratase in catechol pathway [Peribacillus huizhouensis]
MKFGTVKVNGESQVVLVEENRTNVLLLQAAAIQMGEVIPATLLECIAQGEFFLQNIKKIEQWVSKQENKSKFYADDFVWEAPIPRPAKNIFCVGKNYAKHAVEMGSEADIPEHIIVFSKAPTAVIGHEANIPRHEDITGELDYEGELAIVIGKKGKGIKQDEALNYVFGYTIVNDITARDLQVNHKQYLLGKSLDGSCPLGPVIVEKSAIKNPNQLDIETRVNGEIRQQSNTEQFIFPVEEIIAILSKGMTLEPGDIIATGTPAGVGKGFKPPKFLQKGDEISVKVKGIGTLTNTVH